MKTPALDPGLLSRPHEAVFPVILLAILTFLSGLFLFAAAVLQAGAQNLEGAFTGNWTAIIPATADDPGPAAAKKALAVLTALPGVRSARVLEDREIRQMMGPWIGSDSTDTTPLLPDLPVPTLIDITVQPGTDIQHTRRVFEQAIPQAGIDDHSAFLADWLVILRQTRAVLTLLAALVCLAAITGTTHATRLGIAAQMEILDVLHRIGASDGQIAGLFMRRAWWDGCCGGLSGAALAAIIVTVIPKLLRLPAALVSLAPPQVAPGWTVLLVLPLAMAFLAAGSAFITARRVLAAM